MRKCYLARYPLKNNDLAEEVLVQDSHYSEKIRRAWDQLISERKPRDPMLQVWYSDENQVTCMATTNQPFKLE